MATYIAFDTRSGLILSVHHGKNAASDKRHAALHSYPRRVAIAPEHVGEIVVGAGGIEPGKRYKVNTESRTLVVDEGGVGFGFGSTGGVPTS